MMFRTFITTGTNKKGVRRCISLVLIGMGNMGSAMLKGCLSVFPANTLAFSRKDAAKGEALSLETGAVWIDSNRTCAEQSRYIILAVKPQFYDGVLKEIQPVLDDSRIIISLAPSYSICRSEAVPWFHRAYCPRHAEYAGDGG